MLQCGGKRREIDCAVPRDKPVVAINVRVGVGEGPRQADKGIRHRTQGGEGMRR